MNLSECDQLSFHDIAKEWSKEKNHLDYNGALTMLLRGFWRAEFDRSNQTPPEQTCLVLLSQQGGRDCYDPATREYVLGVLPKGDPHCPSIGSHPTFDDLARLDAVDYPDAVSRWPLGRICVSKDVARHWIQDNGHTAMRFWFPDMAEQIDGPPRPPADFSNWDSNEFYSVGHATHLWEGLEPLPNHEVDLRIKGVYSRQTWLKEQVALSGYTEGQWPKQATLVPRQILIRIAEAADKPEDRRPVFLYPDGHGREIEAAPGEWDHPLTRTGFPGRPTTKHLIDAELRRRVEAEEIEDTLIGEAQALSEWAERKYPHQPHAQPTSIANNIRREYNRAKVAINKARSGTSNVTH